VIEQPGVGSRTGTALLPLPSAHAGRPVVAELPLSRRRPPRVSLFVSLAAAAALLAACKKPEAAPQAFERPPAPVTVAAAVARDVPVYLDEIGRAVAKETVWVRSQVGGRVESVRFEDGAELKKGDVLVTIDARPFQARLDAAEASLLAAQASLARAKTATQRPEAAVTRARAAVDLARADFERTQTLIASKAISQAEYDAKKGALAMAEADVAQAQAELTQALPDEKQAEAAVRLAEAAISTAKLDLEYATIRSPIDGRAGKRLVDVGNLVAATNEPLVMVERLDPVYVDFAVQRNRARGTLRVEARLDGEPDEPRVGDLTFVDNAVDAGTGTVTLRATIPNEDRRFWPGRFVKVRLVLETIPGAVLVPAAATQLSGNGEFVYVVKDDGTAEMRPVVLGQRQDDLVVLKEGVKPGEKVVVAGQIAVTPGGKVRVEPPVATAAAEGGK
jgi:multidrug efflux system membrane fusion protein